MARGDFVLFDAFAESIGEKLINLETDDIRLALIIGASSTGVDPTAADATPMWSVGSGVDYDGNEVGTGGAGYSAGGMALSGPELVLASNIATFDDDDSNLSLVQDASGFTEAYWGILYSFTSTLNNAIGYVDLAGPISQVAGPINFNFNASGIFTIAVP